MVRIIIEAPPEAAARLAHIIESEGLQVTYDPPMEQRSIEHEAVQIVYWVVASATSGLVGGTTFALANDAVKKIRNHHPQVKARVEQDDA